MPLAFCYTMYIMKNQEEKDMTIQEICSKLNVENIKLVSKYTGAEGVSMKEYIKIISNGSQRSVWGFINISEFVKERKMTNEIKNVKFESGDVLKSAGWKTPAINQPRGNLFDGYDIPPHSMRLYGPDYLR